MAEEKIHIDMLTWIAPIRCAPPLMVDLITQLRRQGRALLTGVAQRYHHYRRK